MQAERDGAKKDDSKSSVVDPDPNFHIDHIRMAGFKTMPFLMRFQPPSFTHVGKSEFFVTFSHSIYHCTMFYFYSSQSTLQ
jgi:hypothetical protein